MNHGTLYAYYDKGCRCPTCVTGRRAELDRLKQTYRVSHPSRASLLAAYLEQKRLAEAAVQRAAAYWQEIQRLRRQAS